jgi:hypothetical protein
LVSFAILYWGLLHSHGQQVNPFQVLRLYHVRHHNPVPKGSSDARQPPSLSRDGDCHPSH